MSALSRPIGLLWLVGGFLVWSSAFLVLYGLHAIGCTYAWDASTLRIALLGAWVGHVVLAGALVPLSRRAGRGERPDDRGAGFVARASLVLSAAALAATIWIGLPVLAYPLCR
ncbi:hypothetical protein [Salinarimonas ramus]|uniref:Uncharacterized protein n=1 Tax=Salinarimonas ramus TaxID=690164 RepID=A0A917Q5L0_9HYPH|nr:hypothetical protein [Salinarimonas ramus]GGK26523.1 hypothetical protein GCM10011322_11190 [Salinarimonas ramus]